MKTKFFCMLVFSIFLFTGCQGSNAVNSKLHTASQSKRINTESVTIPKSSDDSINSKLKSARPAEIPQLKSEVDSKFSSIKDSPNSIAGDKNVDVPSN